MEKVNITIIGAGAVGLAIAYELSKHHQNILLVEKNESFGQETSSRNSEVIHTGIYYPEGSLKAKLCIKGKKLLYNHLDKFSIPYKKCGKYIVAVIKDELEGLLKLKTQAEKNGVTDLIQTLKQKAQKDLPDVQIEEALFSPSTGIFDTHKYMKSLETLCQDNDTLISYNSVIIKIKKNTGNYTITIKENENTFQFVSDIVINSSGLNCKSISDMILKKNDYKIYYAKGEYFSLSGKYTNTYSSLIYPVVPEDAKSLGIHTVIDMQGMLKFGPNIHYIDNLDYSVEESHKKEFYQAIKRYLPFIKKDELIKDMAGIRAKVQGPHDTFKDFIIKEESDKGYPGFINLIGIESPGLTASLAIAKHIKEML